MVGKYFEDSMVRAGCTWINRSLEPILQPRKKHHGECNKPPDLFPAKGEDRLCWFTQALLS